MNYNEAMGQHYRLLSDTKQQYRELFQQGKAALEARLLKMRQASRCETCDTSATGIPSTVETLTECLEKRHVGCGYRAWQEQALAFIEQEAGREILLKLQQIEGYKNTFSCHMCGMCCRLASSEHSYAELQARAEAGDEFARQFTSIFLPYESREKARQKYPEVVTAVLAEAGEEADGEMQADQKAGSEEKIYFYHCPYVSEDNRCSIFGTDKRPAICASYPETPLSFVYEKCAWRPWKDETHVDTLAAHAMLALCTHWAERLRQALA